MRIAISSLRAIALSAMLLSVACHGTARSGDSPRTDLSVITAAQLRDNRFTDAYSAVESLRSNWLATRGTDSFNTPTPVWVYLDNVKLGGIESLRSIPSNTITFIRHYDGIQATGRWGLGHGQGVIFVSTHP